MLSGKWDIDRNQRKSRNFKASFYMRHINGATRNHTDQISNLWVNKMLLFNLVQIIAYRSEVFWMLEQMARLYPVIEQWLLESC